MGILHRGLLRICRLRGGRRARDCDQHDRKQERALIDWYLDLMAQYDSSDDPAAWHSLLGAAGDIRGFGPVKMQAIETVRASVTEQLAAIGRKIDRKIGQKIGQNSSA